MSPISASSSSPSLRSRSGRRRHATTKMTKFTSSSTTTIATMTTALGLMSQLLVAFIPLILPEMSLSSSSSSSSSTVIMLVDASSHGELPDLQQHHNHHHHHHWISYGRQGPYEDGEYSNNGDHYNDDGGGVVALSESQHGTRFDLHQNLQQRQQQQLQYQQQQQQQQPILRWRGGGPAAGAVAIPYGGRTADDSSAHEDFYDYDYEVDEVNAEVEVLDDGGSGRQYQYRRDQHTYHHRHQQQQQQQQQGWRQGQIQNRVRHHDGDGEGGYEDSWRPTTTTATTTLERQRQGTAWAGREGHERSREEEESNYAERERWHRIDDGDGYRRDYGNDNGAFNAASLQSTPFSIVEARRRLQQQQQQQSDSRQDRERQTQGRRGAAMAMTPISPFLLSAGGGGNVGRKGTGWSAVDAETASLALRLTCETNRRLRLGTTDIGRLASSASRSGMGRKRNARRARAPSLPSLLLFLHEELIDDDRNRDGGGYGRNEERGDGVGDIAYHRQNDLGVNYGGVPVGGGSWLDGNDALGVEGGEISPNGERRLSYASWPMSSSSSSSSSSPPPPPPPQPFRIRRLTPDERRAAADAEELTIFHARLPITNNDNDNDDDDVGQAGVRMEGVAPPPSSRRRRRLRPRRIRSTGVRRWGPDLVLFLETLCDALGCGGDAASSSSSSFSSSSSSASSAVLALAMIYLDRSCSVETDRSSPFANRHLPPCPYLLPRTVHRLSVTAVVLACRALRGETDFTDASVTARYAAALERSGLLGGPTHHQTTAEDLAEMERHMLGAMGMGGMYVESERLGAFLKAWGGTFIGREDGGDHGRIGGKGGDGDYAIRAHEMREDSHWDGDRDGDNDAWRRGYGGEWDRSNGDSLRSEGDFAHGAPHGDRGDGGAAPVDWAQEPHQ